MAEEEDIITSLLSGFNSSPESDYQHQREIHVGPREIEISMEDSHLMDSCVVSDPQLNGDGWSLVKDTLVDMEIDDTEPQMIVRDLDGDSSDFRKSVHEEEENELIRQLNIALETHHMANSLPLQGLKIARSDE